MYQNFIIPYLYEAQHVSGDTPPIIRSLKLHWQPLVFRMWKVVVRVVGGRQAHCAWQRPPTTRPTPFHVWKTRGCQCSFRLLMMGSVLPKICWASYKYGIIKFWYIVLHLVGFFFMNWKMGIGCSSDLLALNLLTWKIWWAPNNASRWQMGFNLALKGLIVAYFPVFHSVACWWRNKISGLGIQAKVKGSVVSHNNRHIVSWNLLRYMLIPSTKEPSSDSGIQTENSAYFTFCWPCIPV